MPNTQTIEDLGKLVKSKYPNTYDSLSDIELGQKVKAKYPEAYGNFADKVPEESALSRFGTGLYNTTVGPVVQSISHPIDTLSNVVGIPQYKGALNQVKQGHYGSALSSFGEILNPGERMARGMAEPVVQDIKSGNYAGAAGQVIGLGASFAAPELAVRLGASKLGVASKAGLKAATPDLAMGGLKTGAGITAGTIAHTAGVPTGYSGLGSIYLAKPGLMQMGKGLAKGTEAFGDSWKGGPVESPGVEPPPIPTKGPTIGELKTAVKNGTMTPEQFDTHVDKITELTPDAKNLLKANVRASQATPIKFPVTSPKTLNLGQLQKSVGSGRMSMEEYTQNLKGLGYTEEHAAELTEQLKDSLEEEKEAEAAKAAKSSPGPKKPKNQTKPPEVKVKPPSQAPQMKVEPPGVPQTPQTSQTPQVSQASPESMIEEATRGEPGTPPEMPVQAPISNNQNLRNLMRPNALEIENPNIQSQANADWTKGKVEAPKVEAPEVEPRHEPYYKPDNPIARKPISPEGIEEAQSMDKLAKETILARHLIKNNIDLDSIPKTSEYLKAVSQEAGLKRVASLRTLENAIKRARELKINPPEKK